VTVSPDGVLEVVFDPTWAAVRLVVDGGMWPAAVSSLTITRSTLSSGPTPVRGVERRPAAGGWYIGTDHEGPLDTSVTYTVTGYAASGVVVASSSVTVDTLGARAGLWVKVPGRADLTTRVAVREVSAVVTAGLGGSYQVAGGGRRVAQDGGLGAEQLQIVVSTDPTNGLVRLRSALRASRVLLLQPVGLLDLPEAWYLMESASQVNPAPRSDAFPQRWVELTMAAVDVPAGVGVDVTGTTWAGLMAEHATWADIVEAFPAWSDVVRGGL
jgi:hypothetical protein